MKKYAVVMAGGHGTRFWPKSSEKKPKQLLALTGKETQLKVTWVRLDTVVEDKNRLIVCTEKLKAATQKEIKGAKILAEPVGRNTLAAICWATWEIGRINPTAVIAALPADAYIGDVDEFRKTLNQAFKLAAEEKKIVCLGIKPTYAATAYGYIRRAKAFKNFGYEVKEFLEKPDSAKANELFASRDYFWNSGIFIFPADLLMNEVRALQPRWADFFDSLLGTSKFQKGYEDLPSVSMDVGIMERTSLGAVIPGNFGWNDLGSWPALAEVLKPNSPAGIITSDGSYITIDSKNIIADIEGPLFLGLVGVEDLIIVKTKNALLVCHQKRAQDIKTLVAEIQKDKTLRMKLL